MSEVSKHQVLLPTFSVVLGYCGHEGSMKMTKQSKEGILSWFVWLFSHLVIHKFPTKNTVHIHWVQFTIKFI